MKGSLRIAIFTTIVFTSSIADHEALGRYPTTNCFDGFPLLQASLINEIQGGVDRSNEYPDKNSFCFKTCMLRDTLLIRTQEIPPRDDDLSESQETWRRNYENIQAFNLTADAKSILLELSYSLYDFDKVDLKELDKDPSYVKIESGMESRANKCKNFGVVIPKKEYSCKRFSPDTREKMEKLKDCIEEALRC